MVALPQGHRTRWNFAFSGRLRLSITTARWRWARPSSERCLAVLLLHRGEPVSTDRLIDEIWGEQPPASANKIVQGYVSNLRKLLGDGRLVTQGRSYVLRIEPGQTDVDRFEALAAQGRETLEHGDALTAAAVAAGGAGGVAGSARWRISPTSRSLSRRSRGWRRLVWLRWRIGSTRIWRRGRTRGWWASSRRSCASTRCASACAVQLMLALYRSGRQADALEAYRDARRELLDELGLEPGRALAELERAILAHDPALDPPAGRPLVARPQPPSGNSAAAR